MKNRPTPFDYEPSDFVFNPVTDLQETEPELSVNISETLQTGFLSVGSPPASETYNHIENPSDVGVRLRDPFDAGMINRALCK